MRFLWFFSFFSFSVNRISNEKSFIQNSKNEKENRKSEQNIDNIYKHIEDETKKNEIFKLNAKWIKTQMETTKNKSKRSKVFPLIKMKRNGT